MTTDLATTNLLLGILAFVSVLEALAVIGLFTAGMLLCRRVTRAMGEIEERRVAPVADRINSILDDVRTVTSTARDGTQRVSDLAGWVVHVLRRRPASGVHPPGGR